MAKRSINQDRRDAAFDKATNVIDVGAVSEDQQLVTTDGATLSAFLGGLAAFFTGARELETKADGLEKRAAAFKAPTDGGEDAALVRFVQEANGTKKAIEAHWEITSVVHRFHRRLTAGRERGATKAANAADRAQRLHNAYTEAERRRAAEETERRQREAELDAQRKRDAETARLEAEAVAREEAQADLSARELAYVTAFVAGATAQIAAQRAGYKDPKAAASRLMVSPKVLHAIKSQQEAAALRRQATAVAARPLEVVDVEAVRPDIEKTGTDRTTWRGECFDVEALQTAFLGCLPKDFTNRFGIPADIWTIDQMKLTEHARQMQELLNRWPGCRAVKSTKTI